MRGRPASLPTLRLAALLVGALASAALLWRLFGPRGMEVELVHKHWRHDVEVERLVLESASDWCDAMPAGAQDVTRRLLSDPSGERAEPNPHCRYTVPHWRGQRTARAEGLAPQTAPHWREPQLAVLPETRLGAERIGRRLAVYSVELAALATDQRWVCALPLAQWQALSLGTRFRLQVDRQGVANCASVPAA